MSSSLSDKQIREIIHYFPELTPAFFEGYTSDSHNSDYRGASSDIDVFDASGQIAFHGRHFASTGTAFWRPTRLATVPEFIATKTVQRAGMTQAEARAEGN